MKKMSDAASAARREYQKQWRKRNPDKVRRNNAAYWERVAERKRVNDLGGRHDEQ